MRVVRTCRISIVVVFGFFLWMAGTAQAQQQGQTGTLLPQRSPAPGQGVYATPPPRPAGVDQERAVAGTFKESPLPDAAGLDPNDVPMLNPETVIAPVGKVNAPGDFDQFINSDLGPPATSVINEPSLGSNGRVIFYTGNWFAGFSGDAGATWSFVDPYDNFPADNVTDVPANSSSFCCDQVVYYQRDHDLMLWFLQYVKSGSTATDSNVQRIAVAGSRDDVLNNNWCWYDFPPSSIGYGAGFWADFPDMATTDDHLYFTTNIFTSTTNSFAGSALVKIPLSELAACGPINFTFWARTEGSLRLAPGHSSRMYVGAHTTLTNLRLFHNDDASSMLFTNDISHTTFNAGFFSAVCADGNDFANRSDIRIQAGSYSPEAGEVLFGWGVKEGGAFPHPYVRMMRIRTSDNMVMQEFDLWSSTEGFIYPSVHVNDRGHWGGVFSHGCGGSAGWPQATAWIVDDFNGFPSLSSLETSTFASSADAPTSNQWGDYNTTRRMVPFGNTWVGAGHRMKPPPPPPDVGGGNDDIVPEFIWFGRERDMPETANRVYVEWRNDTGTEDGTWQNPYDTVGEGETALTPGDFLIIFGGTYLETVLLDSPTEVQNQTGPAKIGGND